MTDIMAIHTVVNLWTPEAMARREVLKGMPSHDLPYEMVAEAVARHPDRFSALAGNNPTLGMQGVRELEHAVKELGFIGARFYPHWYELG